MLVQDPVAPLGAVQAFGLGQISGPGLGDDIEKGDRLLPMFGEFVVRADQGLEILKVEPFRRDLVHQAGQFLGQAQRLVRRFGAPGNRADERCQQGLAAHAGQGRGNVEAARRVVLAAQRQVVGVEVAEGGEPRQQHGAAAGGAQERLGQGADGAPCRQ